MPRRPAPAVPSTRRRQAAELAARHMREGGLGLPRARDKALAQLGLAVRNGHPDWPGDREIQQALETQLALFAPAGRADLLRARRHEALAAMDFLRPFSPRLAGRVLEGSAQAHDPVILHLHPEAPEDVPMFLEDHHLPARQGSAHLLLDGRRVTVPVWHLVVEDTDFQLWVLPATALRQPPWRGEGDPQPLERASAAALRALLAG